MTRQGQLSTLKQKQLSQSKSSSSIRREGNKNYRHDGSHKVKKKSSDIGFLFYIFFGWEYSLDIGSSQEGCCS